MTTRKQHPKLVIPWRALAIGSISALGLIAGLAAASQILQERIRENERRFKTNQPLENTQPTKRFPPLDALDETECLCANGERITMFYEVSE